MRKSCIVLIIAGASMLAGMAFAQGPAADTTPAADQAPAPQAPAAQTPARRRRARPGSSAQIAIHSRRYGFQLPVRRLRERELQQSRFRVNQLRNFDVRANNAHVSLGKITIDRGPAPVGFHLDVGFGQTINMVGQCGRRAPQGFRYFEQAYVDFKPKALHGLQIDVGKFVTSAGAEVIESNANWNYSRSLLFAWAIPYFHFGVRTSFPVGQHFTGGVQVVQGWNNVYDNNSGKTVGLTGAYAWKKVTWSNNYYVGPEKSHTNDGIRHLYDTTVLVNATDNTSFYLNFDYGQEKNLGSGTSKWTGIAGAARHAIGKKFAVAGRLEFFDDIDGFSTGVQQKIGEVTMTGEYKMNGWLMTRLEFRNDWSNQPFFQKNSGTSKTQPTVLLGLVAFLGPKK